MAVLESVIAAALAQRARDDEIETIVAGGGDVASVVTNRLTRPRRYVGQGAQKNVAACEPSNPAFAPVEEGCEYSHVLSSLLAVLNDAETVLHGSSASASEDPAIDEDVAELVERLRAYQTTLGSTKTRMIAEFAAYGKAKTEFGMASDTLTRYKAAVRDMADYTSGIDIEGVQDVCVEMRRVIDTVTRSSRVQHLRKEMDRHWINFCALRDATALSASLDTSFTCGLCLTRVSNLVCVPCGHAMCVECSTHLEKCPMCRASIEGTVQLFL